MGALHLPGMDASRIRGRVLATLPRFGVVALIVAAGLGVAWVAVRSWKQAHDPIGQLIAECSVDERDIQPRLSGGFRWAPLRTVRNHRHAATPKVVTEILWRGKTDKSRPMQHATALAELISGDAEGATRILKSLVSARDANAFNDLAVAHYRIALKNDDPSRLANALVAVDAALRVDPNLAEARFNRALFLETLGLRGIAREAWQHYLRVDPGSNWSTEARDHVKALAPEEDFHDVLKRNYDSLTSDRAAASAFARRFPQMSRTWGETEILGDWARALIAGDDGQAARHLRLARALGDELARSGGNETTKAMVAAIDNADPRRLQFLMQAHLNFAEGRRRFLNDRRPVEAYRLYSLAADQFARAGSPAELRARLYAANMLFEQGKLDQARVIQEQLLASAPPQFPAQRAECLWILGTVAYFRGRLGPALDYWTESLALYERLGEMNYAARIRAQMVFDWDRLGNPALAWKNRMIVLREFGRQYISMQAEALTSVSQAAIMKRDWTMALSFLALELEIANHVGKPLVAIGSLLDRAEVHRRMQYVGLAAADVREARRRIAAVQDPTYRAFLDAVANGVEASLTTDPRSAIALLTKAIDYQSTKLRRVSVPELLRQRGRAYQSIGDLDRAAADFEAGVAEIERHRETLHEGEDRWGVFHAADELFADAIELATLRHDAQKAFDYAERSRARALFDTLASEWRRVTPADVPEGTAIVEYAVHENATYVFVVDGRGVRVCRQSVPRTQVVADIAALVDAAGTTDRLPARRAGQALYRLLIEPVANELNGKSRLAIVPDPTLGGVPFAALLDARGRYLVETHTLMSEPSAAFFTRARRPAQPRRQNALVVFGAQSLGRLPAAEREARAVAQIYPRSTLLTGEHATAEAFWREAADADVVDFAGHSVASTHGARDGYLLIAGRGATEARLETKEIASKRLPKTSLVILAACGTANGEIRATEGAISVARSFLAAGVPSVIATLWPVDDAPAASFFVALHRRLAKGMPAAEALQATQVEWIRRDKRSPAIWAAVQIIGE